MRPGTAGKATNRRVNNTSVSPGVGDRPSTGTLLTKPPSSKGKPLRRACGVSGGTHDEAMIRSASASGVAQSLTGTYKGLKPTRAPVSGCTASLAQVIRPHATKPNSMAMWAEAHGGGQDTSNRMSGP